MACRPWGVNVAACLIFFRPFYYLGKKFGNTFYQRYLSFQKAQTKNKKSNLIYVKKSENSVQVRLCSLNRLEMGNKNAEPIISEIAKNNVIASFSCLPLLFCIQGWCIKQYQQAHVSKITHACTYLRTHTHTDTRGRNQ